MVKGNEKHRRMATRRDIGNRKPSRKRIKIDPDLYLIAHACFKCRKSFKRSPTEKGGHRCPQCDSPLYLMGRSFKTPKMKDIEQWRKVQALYAYGFRFSNYRSHDCEPMPEKFSEVDEFVKRNPNHPLKVATPNQALQPTR